MILMNYLIVMMDIGTFSAYVDESIINSLHSDVSFIKSSSDEIVEVLFDNQSKKLYIRQYDSSIERNDDNDYENEL